MTFNNLNQNQLNNGNFNNRQSHQQIKSFTDTQFNRLLDYSTNIVIPNTHNSTIK
jgi:hypothetical protein